MAAGDPYFECTNSSLSVEDILKKLIVKDAAGNPVLNTSIDGDSAIVTATLTRPADTTAYAAKDTIANATSGAIAIEFAGAGRVAGGSGYITGFQIETDQTANVAQYKLHPFRQPPAAVISDNTAYVEKFTDAAIRMTDIIIPALTNNGGASNTAKMEVMGLMIPYKCATGSTSIFAQLETLTAFTPASGQIYKITLFFEQN